MFRYKFGTEFKLNCNRFVNIKRSGVFLQKKRTFLEFLCILKEIESRRKFFRQFLTEYLRLFCFSIVSVQLKWNGARSLYQKLNVQVPSRLSERLKTLDFRKMSKFQENCKIERTHSLFPVSIFKIQIWL